MRLASRPKRERATLDGRSGTHGSEAHHHVYDFPEDLDASDLVGREVALVSFTANTVVVAFDEGYAITLLGRYTHHRDEVASEHVEVPPQQSQLMRLVGSTIAAAIVEDDSTLVLRFSNGDKLGCLGDTKQYECYWLQTPTRLVVV